MNIEDIINLEEKQAAQIISELKQKSVFIRPWAQLEEEYNPKKHPVMNQSLYPDRVEVDGSVTKVTRTTYALQKLAVKRLTELCFGIPVKRVYADVDKRPELKEVADFMEAIYKKNRIDSVNNDRARSLFASCEAMTCWYYEQKDTKYGSVDSKYKLRCVTYTPMKGDELYPLFDEYGDLIALSVQYKRKVGTKDITYFDAYTATTCYKWNNGDGEMKLIEQKPILMGKIPAVYVYRPEPAWEDTSGIVYEMEWSMSRNGNYLRENSRPLFVVYADEEIPFGNEPPASKADKSILKYPRGSQAQYVTWQQAVDSLRFHVTELRQIFFTQLQLPDWSFDNMKSVPQSGESMKQMFIDAVLKVTDESGRLIEFLDREVNVIKEFMKLIRPDWKDLIDELMVENVITPCMIDAQAKAVEEQSGEIKDGTRTKAGYNTDNEE